jgi:hypothetical protein
MVPANSGFHMRKNFSKNCKQFGHASSKYFASPALGRKDLNIGLKGAKLLA